MGDSKFTPIMYLIAAGIWAIAPPMDRGEAHRAEFVRGAHRETELRKRKVEAHTACELVSETVEGWCTHI